MDDWTRYSNSCPKGTLRALLCGDDASPRLGLSPSFLRRVLVGWAVGEGLATLAGCAGHQRVPFDGHSITSLDVNLALYSFVICPFEIQSTATTNLISHHIFSVVIDFRNLGEREHQLISEVYPAANHYRS